MSNLDEKMLGSNRLSPAQWQRAQRRALQFQQQVQRQGKSKGFSEVFQIAALKITQDVDSFCDRAEILFEEIEAYGREPQLDDTWLEELTGEKDSFYFSTESLVSDPLKLPSNRGQERTGKPPNEGAVVQTIEETITDLEQALAVAHTEDVQGWIERIRYSLIEEQGETIEFWQLKQKTRLPTIALWLGLLLGHQHWKLSQHEFYGSVAVQLIPLDTAS